MDGLRDLTVAPKSSQALWSVDSLTQGNVTPTWHQAGDVSNVGGFRRECDACSRNQRCGEADPCACGHGTPATKKFERDGVEAVKQRLAQEGVEKVRVW